MSGETLELEARLKDYISGELDKIGSKLEGFHEKQRHGNDLVVKSTDQLKQSWNLAAIAAGSFVGAMGGMTVINKTTEFFKMGRLEAQENIRINTQLKASLGFVSSALDEQATILGDKLVIDNEEVKQVQQRISLFTKDEEQIKKLTRASLDFAAVTGGDARSIARAIESNSIELKRWGITLNESEGSLERIDEIAEKVNTRFGGQAEAVANAKDWWDRLGVSIRDTAEEVNMFYKEKAGQLDPETVAARELARDKKRLQMMEEEIKLTSLGDVLVRKEREQKALYLREDIKNRELMLEATNKYQQWESNLVGSGLQNRKQKEKETEDAAQIERDKKNKERIKRWEELEKSSAEATYNYWLQYFKSLEQAAAEAEKTKQALRLEGERNTAILIENAQKREQSLREREASVISDPGRRELALFDVRRDAEIKAFKGTEEQKKRMTAVYAHERKEIEKSNKIESIEAGLDFSINAMGTIAKATKAGSAVQKGLDVAQATANTAIAVTKALSQPWQIPFIIALGMAQVALITRQQYAGGGIIGGGSPSQGDVVPIMATPGEMVLNGQQQANLFNQINRPNVNNSSSINLNINVGSGGTYDMNAARYTVDALVPVLGDAMTRAKREGRLREYETV